MKDILVDNTVAKNFCNPVDPHYKTFIQWIANTGVLVVTQSLLTEYLSTSASSPASTSMPSLIDRLTRDGRIRRFGKEELKAVPFTPKILRHLKSNRKDHDNIKAVMLSVRKFAVSHDGPFRNDVNKFPGHTARAELRPQDLPYK